MLRRAGSKARLTVRSSTSLSAHSRPSGARRDYLLALSSSASGRHERGVPLSTLPSSTNMINQHLVSIALSGRHLYIQVATLPEHRSSVVRVSVVRQYQADIQLGVTAAPVACIVLTSGIGAEQGLRTIDDLLFYAVRSLQPLCDRHLTLQKDCVARVTLLLPFLRKALAGHLQTCCAIYP
jgi:hypothetical protein